MLDFTELWSGLDYMIIVVYFAAVIVIGVIMRRRASKNMKAFLLHRED